MENESLTREVEALREQLAALRAEREQAEVTSAGLEEQLYEAKDRLELARRAIADHETLLADKHDQLRNAQREEALQHRDEAAARLAEAISQVLVELEAHEAAEQAVSAVDGPPGRPRDHRDGLERDVLAEPWGLLKEAVRRRSDIEFAEEVVEAAARSRTPDAMNALPAHLREAARARVQARRRQRQDRAR